MQKTRQRKTKSIRSQIKTDAKTTATQLETPKTDATKTDASATKQDPAKKTTESSTTKTDAKKEKSADTSNTDGGGNTRMAISEQGTPKKNKNKGKSKTSAPPAEAPKK